MRGAFLGQPVIMPDPSGYAMDTAQVFSFQQQYDRLVQIWPAFLAMGDDLDATRRRYLNLAAQARSIGDNTAAVSYESGAARMAAAFKIQRDTVASVNAWRDTWESIRDSITASGTRILETDQWFGLGGLEGVVIATSAVAGIAVLGIVVSRYLSLRQQLAREREILRKIDAGTITATQGAELIKAGAPGGLFEGIGSALLGNPMSWVVLIGGGLLVATQFTGRR